MLKKEETDVKVSRLAEEMTQKVDLEQYDEDTILMKELMREVSTGKDASQKL